MGKLFNRVLLSIVAMILISASSCYSQETIKNFNFDWLFTETDSYDYTLTTYTPSTPEWESVTLPHDWSIDKPFSSQYEGATGFSPGGIGWYSKTFNTPIDVKSERCYILFDGVYNNAEYWINGKRIAFHPYGYAPIYFDLTDYLAPKGEENRISVRVDHSRYVDSRWYTGSGIYRNVKLITTDNLHIGVWGIYATTPKVTKDEAIVRVEVALENNYFAKKDGAIVIDILDANKNIVASKKSSFTINSDSEYAVDESLNVVNPNLWGIESPYLYSVNTTLELDGKVVEKRETPIGIRTIEFDKDKGFFLNGESTKVKGVCLHHDAGLVGTAVPKDVWRRRLQALKDMGCNAIRTSHNPASDEFLDVCDELGFLVQNEFYDEWDLPKDKRYNMHDKEIDYISRGHSQHFQKWAKIDLQNTMLSSRNHPSIFQWSIGNEIEWTYPGHRTATGLFNGTDKNEKVDWTLWRVPIPPHTQEEVREFWANYPEQTYNIGETATKLASWTKELDTTRFVTANLILPTSSLETEYARVLDVVGFSYKPAKYDYFREIHPEMTMMGTENVVQWYEWEACIKRDYIAGIFLWTGVEYLGEHGAKDWPVRGGGGAPLDLACFEKPSYDMFKSLWKDNEAVIAIYSQTADKSLFKDDENGVTVEKKKDFWKTAPRPWQDVNKNWNYKAGEKVYVEVYTNCDEVELFQNGKSLGTKKLADNADHIIKWGVDYKAGKITAKGVRNTAKYGKQKATAIQETVGEIAAIKLTPDKTVMSGNSCDVVTVVAQLVDKRGREISIEEMPITFEYSGDVTFLGTDCGHGGYLEKYRDTTCRTFKGRCLISLQAKDLASEVVVKAKGADGRIISNEVKVIINK